MNYRDVVLFILEEYNTENPDSTIMLHTKLTDNNDGSYMYDVIMHGNNTNIEIRKKNQTSNRSVAEQEAFKLILNQIIDYDRF
jgi:hypothetical protein